MASPASLEPLSVALDRYRSRILQVNCNMLTRLLEANSISPYSTDPADLELIAEKEWGSYYKFPPTIQSPNDIYSLLLSNGTSPPLPQERREEWFQEIEVALNAQAAPKYRPVYLPDDFKQLCELTDSLEGAGLPESHSTQTPDAFNGLVCLLPDPKRPLSVTQLAKDSAMDDEDWEVAAGCEVAGFAGHGGMWLCLCRTSNVVGCAPDADQWKWRWCGRNGVDDVVEYEDVRDLLDEYWDEWRGIECVYGDLGYENIRENIV